MIYDHILLFCNDYYVYYSVDVFLFNKNCQKVKNYVLYT